ncbi:MULTISPECIES: VOC family protein [unclassified Paenibacillus]|uniref:VOC family protein n=1 Tax=unclassified Paenibacillus TaxID=185978 RepID=UPI001F1213D3|nr:MULTISPECIES: VOC family protein [unclassified Paenibacillus]
MHHLELYVSDLEASAGFWGWLLGELGYEPYQRWEQGRSWKKDRFYLVLVQVEERHREPAYHRRKVGMNHVAFHASSRGQVDRLAAELAARGTAMLYGERYPYGGGEGHYALFCEDPDRIKVEVVAPD